MIKSGGLPPAKKQSPGLFFPRLRSGRLFAPSHRNPQKYTPHGGRRRKGQFSGADGGGRTRTVSLPTDFESVTSANSITSANQLFYYSRTDAKNQE